MVGASFCKKNHFFAFTIRFFYVANMATLTFPKLYSFRFLEYGHWTVNRDIIDKFNTAQYENQ